MVDNDRDSEDEICKDEQEGRDQGISAENLIPEENFQSSPSVSVFAVLFEGRDPAKCQSLARVLGKD